MRKDPIVEEIRANREAKAKKLNFDLKKIISAARKRQAKTHRKVVSFQNTAKH